MAEIIRYANVDISYNGNVVVRDISLALEEGGILGIVGESGSGKSTLIRAAMGLLGPGGMVTRGDILFRGMDLPDFSEKERQKVNGSEIGMVFQYAGASFCPIRKVGDLLYESMTEHEKITRRDFEDKAMDLLLKLGFDDGRLILEKYPFELSGGQQQRVGIAAAMLLEPALLLADEPTSALDVSVQKQVVDQLLFLRETFGTSVIIVTHNIGVVRYMADHVLVMKDGRAVEYGTAEQILDNPQDEYTKTLMAAVPRLWRD